MLFINLASYGQWQQTNGPYGGYVHALAIDSSEVYAGTPVGVFKSTDNGTTWIRKLPHFTTKFAISDYVIYSGCEISSNGPHLNRSLDGGNNWERADSTLPTISFPYHETIVRSLAIYGSIVFAGIINSGIYISLDTGKTWTPRGLPNTQVSAINIIGNKIYAGTGEEGLYSSVDTGNTWTFCAFGFPQYANGNYYPINSVITKGHL